jgi:hypothetical protein
MNPDDEDPAYSQYVDDDVCPECEGWGYFEYHCGGDLCVCHYNGERPCWNCN